jgi:hypothetical protein
MKRIFVSITLVSLFVSREPGFSGDWPGFRGPNAASVSQESGLPTTWSDQENIAWKTELPGPGSSSPIVSGDLVFVTCYSGYGVDRSSPGDVKNLVRHLVCVRIHDGSTSWKKDIQAAQPEDPYEGFLREHGYASSTPATDGQRVFAFFGKSGVFAFDRDGRQLWEANVGTGSGMNGWGSGTSVVLHKSLVIVNANAESQTLVALDKETGKRAWEASAKGYAGSWSTPILAETATGTQELVVQVSGEVWGLDPSDGGLLWYSGGLGRAPTNPTLAAKAGIVYALRGGPGGSAAVAIRAGGRDDVTESRVVWKKPAGSYVPSPLIVEDRLHWVDDKGFAHCLKLDSGEEVYKSERLPDAGGVYASLVAADGKLYAVTRRNGTFVLAGGSTFKQLAQNKIGSDATDFNASPAVSNGHILLRSNRFLYSIGGKGS